MADLQREIAAAWQTDEVRRERVTPLDEVPARDSLYSNRDLCGMRCRQSLRAVDSALTRGGRRALPLDAAPIRFGSWIGGDRDGNPSITAGSDTSGHMAGTLAGRGWYLKDVVALRSELSRFLDVTQR